MPKLYMVAVLACSIFGSTISALAATTLEDIIRFVRSHGEEQNFGNLCQRLKSFGDSKSCSFLQVSFELDEQPGIRHALNIQSNPGLGRLAVWMRTQGRIRADIFITNEQGELLEALSIEPGRITVQSLEKASVEVGNEIKLWIKNFSKLEIAKDRLKLR